jgi:hypothetical protein
MRNNNAKVNFQIRSSDDRRRVGGRRLFREQEYLDHNPERRINLFERRMIEDRRKIAS